MCVLHAPCTLSYCEWPNFVFCLRVRRKGTQKCEKGASFFFLPAAKKSAAPKDGGAASRTSTPAHGAEFSRQKCASAPPHDLWYVLRSITLLLRSRRTRSIISVCVLHIKTFSFYNTRRHPAHPLPVLIHPTHIREMQALWSQNDDAEILRTS